MCIESVVYEQLHEPVKVYNFEVEDYHTYFVGRDGWLVHNICFEDRAIFHEWGKEYQRNGISRTDAVALWDLACEFGVPGHKPQKYSHQGGNVYHLKKYGYHINIY